MKDLKERIQEPDSVGSESLISEETQRVPREAVGFWRPFAAGFLGVYILLNLSLGYIPAKKGLKEGKNKQWIEQELLACCETQKGGGFFYKITKPGREITYFFHGR